MFKHISITNKAHAAYIADAIAALYADMDWLTADDMNDIRVYHTRTDWVAIPAIYCDETTEFTTLNGLTVRLDSGRWGEEIITEVEA